MALTDKLTAIANAIRAKTGKSATMTLAEMPTEIGSIETGITPTGSINITQNGTYDVTEKASAVVSVSGQAPTLITKSISTNGTYNASSDNADGYSQVTVNVPTPTPSYDTPTVSVSAAGVVTATANGKSNTHQLSSSDDADFIAANIKEGVALFGVLGTLSGGGGSLPSFMTACAETEWIATGIANSQYCAIPHGLGVRPDYVRVEINETVSGSYYALIEWDLWRLGWVANGTSGSFGHQVRYSSSNNSWTVAFASFSSSHHYYADSTNFYIYNSNLTSMITSGKRYKITAYRLDIPSEWRGEYEYTTDPTV